MTRFPMRSLLLTGVVLACAVPAAAHADSLVYIDHGNVFSAKPDGSGRVQLTDGGQWHSPTQADDGTIAAVDGTGPITVMTRDGKVLRTIATAPAKSGDGGTFAPRPVDLSFSPDGSKIAYSYVAYSCPVASTCGTIQRSTFYTRADATPNATPIATWGNQFSVSDPEWITNDRTIVFGGAGSQVDFDDLDSGADYNYKNWFNDLEDMGDGELARNGRNLATTYSYGSDLTIVFWSAAGPVTSGAPPAAPKYACKLGETDEQFADPTWSPDSMSVAYASKAGIEAATFSRLEPNPSEGGAGCAVSADEHLVIPGAGSPDWGPADPPASRYAPLGAQGAPAPPAPATTVPATPAPRPAPAPGVKGKGGALTAGGAATQRFTGRVAVVCRTSTAGTCRAVAAVKVGKRTYRSKAVTAKVAAGRAATLKVTFGRSATMAIRKALKRARCTAVVTLTAGGAKATKVVTLKR
jgi:hypothetical protein